jgi:hydroxymethylpyrimidine kinase/phosphomethylpyrimidine kinase
MSPTVAVVAVGGLDPGGGAGIIRDLLSLTDLGARAFLVGTAWTIQSPSAVGGFEPRAPDAVAAALRAALDQSPRGRTSVKVGMTATPHIVRSIVDALAGFEGPVVFDPVLAASTGRSLFAGDPAELFPLIERAALTTPNLTEAAALCALPPLTTVDEACGAARRLCAMGASAVLVKGGHLEGEPTDVFVRAGGAGGEGSERRFSSARLPGESPRGTGCALASAIAVGLARGEQLPAAIGGARAWLLERIRKARTVGDERHL